MPTPEFPSSLPAPSLPIGGKPDDPAIRSDAEGGYTLTRPRYTRIRKEWSLKWNAMTAAQLSTLLTFWGTVKGGSIFFTWTAADDDVSKTVRFAGSPEYSLIAPDTYEVSVSIQEV